MDCVYLVQDANGITKVGISNNVKARMAELQVGSPTLLTLRYVIECSSIEIARRIEVILHNHYRDYRTQGEWFKIDAGWIVQDLRLAVAMFPVLEGVVIRRNVDIGRIALPPTRSLERLFPPPRYGEKDTNIANLVIGIIERLPHIQMTSKEIASRLPWRDPHTLDLVISQLLELGHLIEIRFDKRDPFKGCYYITLSMSDKIPSGHRVTEGENGT